MLLALIVAGQQVQRVRQSRSELDREVRRERLFTAGEGAKLLADFDEGGDFGRAELLELLGIVLGDVIGMDYACCCEKLKW